MQNGVREWKAPMEIAKKKQEPRAEKKISSRETPRKETALPLCPRTPQLVTVASVAVPSWLRVTRGEAVETAMWVMSQKFNKKFFQMRQEIYPFFDAHWDKLWRKHREKNANWQGLVNMILSKYDEIYQSGATEMHAVGYWGLRAFSASDKNVAIPEVSLTPTSRKRKNTLMQMDERLELSPRTRRKIDRYSDSVPKKVRGETLTWAQFRERLASRESKGETGEADPFQEQTLQCAKDLAELSSRMLRAEIDQQSTSN